MPSAPTPPDAVPAVAVAPSVKRVLIKTWRTGWDNGVSQAERVISRGDHAVLLHLVSQPYPSNDNWQKLKALGADLVSECAPVGDDAALDASDLEAKVDRKLAQAAIQREAFARAPKALPAPAAEQRRSAAEARRQVQRTPAERKELLRLMYESGMDGTT